jgi:hypothetical protein
VEAGQELVEEIMTSLLLESLSWISIAAAVQNIEMQIIPLTGMQLSQTTLPMQEQFKAEFLTAIKWARTTTEAVS